MKGDMIRMEVTTEELKIITGLRPCMAKNRKALFHKWAEKSRIVGPSPMVGGDNGGVIKGVVGIIEFEDGTVVERLPSDIRFLDTDFKNYCFGE